MEEEMKSLDTIAGNEEVTKMTELSGTFLEKAQSAVINTDADVEKASVFLSKIKSAGRQAETMRKAFVKPLNDHVKNINSFFKELTNPVTMAEGIVKDKVLIYRSDQEAKRRKEQSKLDREAAARQREADEKAAENEEPEQAVAPVIAKQESKVGAASFKKVWTFQIMDVSKVPVGYKTVNEVRIRQAIMAGVREIEGVRIYQEEQMANRFQN